MWPWHRASEREAKRRRKPVTDQEQRGPETLSNTSASKVQVHPWKGQQLKAQTIAGMHPVGDFFRSCEEDSNDKMILRPNSNGDQLNITAPQEGPFQLAETQQNLEAIDG